MDPTRPPAPAPLVAARARAPARRVAVRLASVVLAVLLVGACTPGEGDPTESGANASPTAGPTRASTPPTPQPSPTPEPSDETTVEAEPASPYLMVDGDVELECPTGAVAPGAEPDDRLRFSASALSGDLLSGDLEARDPAAVEAALDALRASGATDVTLELQGVPAAEARWFVLRETDEGTLVAVGAWPPSGPADAEAGVVLLTPAAGGGLEPSTWLPSCRPSPIPAQDGAFWVHLGAPDVTAQDSELVVELIEAACTFARDPAPYLREPVVTETDDAVTITWSSSFTPVDEEPTPEKPLQAMDCPANPVITRTVTLAAPLGDRAALDGSSWPARDIRGQGVW